jgi:hypothetical protein
MSVSRRATKIVPRTGAIAIDVDLSAWSGGSNEGVGMRVLPAIAAAMVIFASHDSPGALGRLSPLGVSFAALSSRMTPPPSMAGPASTRTTKTSPCPAGMVSIDGSYCIDAYEASLVQEMPDGSEVAWPYYEAVSPKADVRAVSRAGVYPQGYISGTQSRAACARSGKRLCKPAEWTRACMGPGKTVFPYGNTRMTGTCNDNGRSGLRFFNPQLDDKPEHRWMWGYGGNMNDPRINQLPGTLTHTGERSACTNGYGVFDMVGNVHEWVDDPAGTFQGGYYLDTHINGDGCHYRTTAHAITHSDYSTGFRCCADTDDD